MNKNKSLKPGYGKLLEAWTPPAAAGDAVGCIATSFTFSPAFFEEECVGRLLQLQSNAETDGAAYLVEREEKLAQLMCASALVDQHNAKGLRNLRWDLLSARLPRGILHAKVSVLLWTRHARVIVASANLTEDGYRRNQEVFAVLDYHSGGEQPLAALHAILAFLRYAAEFSQAPDSLPSPALARWNAFLDYVRELTGEWGVTAGRRSREDIQVIPVLCGPGREDALTLLRNVWPGSPPEWAYVISPFFDPPEAENRPAQRIWDVVRQRGHAYVEYDVMAEDVPDQNAVLINAPASLVSVCPRRPGVEVAVKRLAVEQLRPLHAKCIWLQSEQFIAYMLGSSNFTSAGLGLGAVANIEANLVFIVRGDANTAAKRALDNAWLAADDIPEDVERRWQPIAEQGVDAPSPGEPVLPVAFAEAIYQGEPNGGASLKLAIGASAPSGWALFVEDEASPFMTDALWAADGRPAELRIPWERSRPPSGLRVTWAGSEGAAWWPVNVLSSESLPPPEELKNLPLEVLIDVLTSARPLHQALANWLKRRERSAAGGVDIALDPHKRVDVSAFLLQRTRRISWALKSLRERLEAPVSSDQALSWRLRGPVGVQALADAIARDARSPAERCFLLAELSLELGRVNPQSAPGCLASTKVRTEIRELARGIRASIPDEAFAGHAGLAEYVQTAFDELVK